MNKLLTFIVLLCSLMFSSSSFGEWTDVASYPQGDTYYVDFDRLRKHDGFYYYWTLIDKSQPLGGKFMSLTNYSQADCGKFAYKTLKHNFYEQQMGVGAPETLSEESDWIYPSPTSANEIMLKQVCDQ
jgi:hypothetical protein